jgi:N-acetyl-alpha-D-muramate 1-phosphate uridylyltransferase
MREILPVAVLAGGLGTRVRHRTGPSVPKALLPINGVPFIDLKLRELRDAGASRIVLLVGHGGAQLERHVGSGAKYGLEVSVVRDPPHLLGTGGALYRALPELGPMFIVTYGDTLLDVPLDQLGELMLSSNATGVMTLLTNEDRWEISNVDVTDGWVTAYEKPAQPGRHRHLDYGMIALRACAFDDVSSHAPFDLSDTWRSLARRRMLRAMFVNRRFYDIGSEVSIVETERFLRSIDNQVL